MPIAKSVAYAHRAHMFLDLVDWLIVTADAVVRQKILRKPDLNGV